MSERHIPHNGGEHLRRPEQTHGNHEALRQHHEAARESAERNKPSVEAARRSVEQHAAPTKRESIAPTAEVNDANDGIRWWSGELQVQALDRMLSSVRRRLSKPERRLSRIIHQPVVEKVSDVGAKTVARPSGILFGGIFSFVGSLVAYLLAKHLGGELRFSVFLLFFAGGFIVGLFVELGVRLFRIRYRS